MRPGFTALVVACCAALVLLLAYGLASKGTDDTIESALAAGGTVPAPLATLPVLGESGTRSLADFRGRGVLVNFWAAWCPPCLDELPLLRRTHERLAVRGATVLGIDTKDFPEDALGLVHRFGLPYPSLRDRGGEYARRFGLTGYPESFLVDRAGRIVAARRGPLTQRWLDTNLPRIL